MNDLTISIKQLLATISDNTNNGKYKTLFKIFLIMLSVLMIYKAGKSLGEFIYYISA